MVVWGVLVAVAFVAGFVSVWYLGQCRTANRRQAEWRHGHGAVEPVAARHGRPVARDVDERKIA